MENRNLNPKGAEETKPILVYIIAIYVAALLIANIVANYIITIGFITVSAGILAFPLTYILSAVLLEVFGYKWARRAAWLALSLNAAMALTIQLVILFPHMGNPPSEYFATAVGGTWRIIVASLSAFAFAKFVNDVIFHKMKQKKAESGLKGFTFRAMSSSFAGHLLDSTIFTLIAFLAVVPNDSILPMIVTSFALKWAYEWLALPLTFKIVKWVKQTQN